MRILIIEDEKRLSDSIKKGLSEAGYAVDQAFEGEDGLYLAGSEAYDCLILDIMLPRLNGMEVCKKLRAAGNFIPILMLTARDTVEDIAAGLDSGADDYLTKPFSLIELKSRIQAIIRRSQHDPSPILKLDDLELDPGKHTVRRAGCDISLTPKEFGILEYLLRHKDEVVTRTMITEHVWDYNFDSMSNVVDVFMAALRKKVDHGAKNKLIHTVHGVGFTMSLEKP
jgi:DNA-binding response OmpR family regulator